MNERIQDTIQGIIMQYYFSIFHILNLALPSGASVKNLVRLLSKKVFSFYCHHPDWLCLHTFVLRMVPLSQPNLYQSYSTWNNWSEDRRIKLYIVLYSVIYIVIHSNSKVNEIFDIFGYWFWSKNEHVTIHQAGLRACLISYLYLFFDSWCNPRTVTLCQNEYDEK